MAHPRKTEILQLFAKASLDFIFPRTCRVCGTSLTLGERLLCTSCNADLPRTFFHHNAFNAIHHLLNRSHKVDIAAGWFHYYRHSPYSKLIHEAKYGDRPATAAYIGECYGSELASDGLCGKFDVLIPVPLHPIKFFLRGYNQSEHIARGLARQLNCDVADNLFATRYHSTQTRQNLRQRTINASNSFALHNPQELNGLSIAVVDDIITTGATVNACLDALSATHPSSVSVLTIGVTTLN